MNLVTYELSIRVFKWSTILPSAVSEWSLCDKAFVDKRRAARYAAKPADE